MIYLYGLIKNSDTDFIVENWHYQPFDEINGLHKTTEELEQTGFLVNSLPDSEFDPTKINILHVNPQTRNVWYEHIEITKTQEQINEERLSALEIAMAEMLGV